MVGVFHHIGDEGDFTNTIEQILAYNGVVTFDGAYKSVYQHRERLAEKRPLMFIQGDTIGGRGVMTEDEINDLAQNYNFTLGWHGWSHERLTDLPDHSVIRELSNPDPNVYKLYAYPHGDFDERTRNIVQKMGYLKAYSTTQGNDHPYSLHREYI